MRRPLLGLVVALGLSAVGAEAQAQLFGGVNDPALAYYGLYLPRQQQQAMLGGAEATLNAVAANRQQYAATNRNGMFDPNSNGMDSDDFGDFTTRSGPRKKRTISANTSKFGVHGGNLNGLGPQSYYNTASRYYRDLRTGRGKNANVFAGPTARRGGGMGGGGYGGVGGVPGPR